MLAHIHFADAFIVKVSGPDSERYLESRLTNSVKSLVADETAMAVILDAQGKVEGCFQVLRTPDSRFLLICDGGDHAEIETALLRYKVADRVDLENCSEQFMLWHLSADVFNSVANVLKLEGHKTPFDPIWGDDPLVAYTRERTQAAGVDILISPCRANELKTRLAESGSTELSPERYAYERISANRPAYPEELGAHHQTVTEFPLEEAISNNKGCYVGHEVVERSSSKGRAPFVLARLRLIDGSAVAKGDEIFLDDSDSRCGVVVTKAIDPNSASTVCFARIKNTEYRPNQLFRIGTSNSKGSLLNN